ncbi:glycosyltransferase family 2 protein [Candidatus Methylocalor cossyra]|uniref:Glyco_trans_2-like domain-containing protein n=1 Tax=Candidatus Methylocalor cossyra TaxID=3108543 RepID=A0ABP1C4I2_9GAMM
MEGTARASILVATHNRPALLREALASVAHQSSRQWELVVVDDGSDPPVEEATVRAIVGDRFRLVRHEQAKGIAGAKNAGVEQARGEILLHLDDDDLLAKDAVARIIQAFHQFPELECLFVSTTAFGKGAEYGIESQRSALNKVLALAAGTVRDELVLFDRRLFLGLLESIPWPFQRPAARRAVWERIGRLPSDVAMPEPEWSLKAALQARTALLLPEVYRVRLDGQSYVSQPSKQAAQIASVITSRTRLLQTLTHDPQFREFRCYAPRVRANLARAHFRMAYYHWQRQDGKTARASAARSFRIQPSWNSLKLWARSWL